MEEQNAKIKQSSKDQDFIVETPVVVEEKIGNDKIIKYERGKFLGKGGFAKCYEMRRVDTGLIYAAKVLDKRALVNKTSRNKLINEIKLHKKLHHENIVNFEHFFEDKENVYILLELCSNQTLNDLIKRRKRLSEIEVQCYLLQILKGLKYIHNHKIIHRDLKPGNLFLNQKIQLKIGDFGLASKLEYDGQKRYSICGTPNYIAPEILEEKGYSYEVDIWSLGVIAYTMFFGVTPFETDDADKTYKRIKANCYSFPVGITISPQAKSLITQILNPDPSKRLTIEQIEKHEFFKIYNYVPDIMPLSTLACPLNKETFEMIEKKKERGLSKSQRNSSNLSTKSGNYFSHKITKVFDYSNKFGIFYYVNNTHIGVVFNDFSNIIKTMNKYKNNTSFPNSNTFDYIYIDKNAKTSQNFDEISLENFLSSKKTSRQIIQKFEVFKQVAKQHQNDFSNFQSKSTFTDNNILFFVRKFLITKAGIVFRLSNKILQIMMNDKTFLCFTTEKNSFDYINTKGEETEYYIEKVMNSEDLELIKKIRLAKNILINYGKTQKEILNSKN